MKRSAPAPGCTDLSVEAFLALRATFLDDARAPIPYTRPPKGGTQADPLDTLITDELTGALACVSCRKSGNNTSPDIALFRGSLCNGVPASALEDACDRIIAMEVKKLERRTSGKIARDTGGDYNSTPPCGKVRIYDRKRRPLDVRGFYLFVDETLGAGGKQYLINTIILCDGNALNEDFEFYKQFLTPVKKDAAQGSYGEGNIRRRRMAIFPNPLSCAAFMGHATLVHRADDLAVRDRRLVKTHTLRRTRADKSIAEFSCYRMRADVPPGTKVEVLTDPFAKVKNPRAGTRGMFVLDVAPLSAAAPESATEDVEIDTGPTPAKQLARPSVKKQKPRKQR
jgi:hypothetical protein